MTLLALTIEPEPLTAPIETVDTVETPQARDYAKVTLEAWIRLATYFIEDLGLHGEEVELVLTEAGDQDAADKAKEWRTKHAVPDTES
jgi:hypothetical protein